MLHWPRQRHSGKSGATIKELLIRRENKSRIKSREKRVWMIVTTTSLMMTTVVLPEEDVEATKEVAVIDMVVTAEVAMIITMPVEVMVVDQAAAMGVVTEIEMVQAAVVDTVVAETTTIIEEEITEEMVVVATTETMTPEIRGEDEK